MCACVWARSATIFLGPHSLSKSTLYCFSLCSTHTQTHTHTQTNQQDEEVEKEDDDEDDDEEWKDTKFIKSLLRGWKQEEEGARGGTSRRRLWIFQCTHRVMRTLVTWGRGEDSLHDNLYTKPPRIRMEGIHANDNKKRTWTMSAFRRNNLHNRNAWCRCWA